MLFHENRLLADDSHASRRFSWNIIPYFFRNLGKMLQNFSSAAVVIGTLNVKGKSSCILVDFTIRMNAKRTGMSITCILVGNTNRKKMHIFGFVGIF